MTIHVPEKFTSLEVAAQQQSQPDLSIMSLLLRVERRARFLRRSLFGHGAADDTVWPLVLELFAAHLQGSKIRTKALCATCELPQTTVLRYLNDLERQQIVCRDHDPLDHRVTLVSLTGSAAEAMQEYYRQVVKGNLRFISELQSRR
jgi:hypothetical protein